MLGKLKDLILYRSYLSASENIARRAVARYARGNVALQQGRYATASDLELLHLEGERAARRLEARIDRAFR